MRLNKQQLNELANYVMNAYKKMGDLISEFEMLENEVGHDDPVFRYEQSILQG